MCYSYFLFCFWFQWIANAGTLFRGSELASVVLSRYVRSVGQVSAFCTAYTQKARRRRKRKRKKKKEKEKREKKEKKERAKEKNKEKRERSRKKQHKQASEKRKKKREMRIKIQTQFQTAIFIVVLFGDIIFNPLSLYLSRRSTSYKRWAHWWRWQSQARPNQR